jgi:hypothetical protein
MGSSFRILIDLSQLVPLGSPITESVLPHLSRAVQVITETTQARWVAYAHGAPLPDGTVIHNRTGEYARSIQLRQTGSFSAEVFSVLPYAEAIETGSPARDLKKMLSSSLKVRLTKDGRRYLIIPFRWSVPGSKAGNNMPKELHKWWKGVPQSGSTQIVNGDLKYKRRSGTGAFDLKTRLPIMVPAWRYAWGTRTTRDDLEGLGLSAKAVKHLQGMYRFRPSAAHGGGSHGQYLTFRMMVEGSKGWNVPAQPGKYPARTVSQEMTPLAEEAFRRAVEADIKALLGG